MSDAVGRKLPKCFRNVERISEELTTERVYEPYVDSQIVVSRPSARWFDKVKKACAVRSIELKFTRENYMNRVQLRDVLNGTNGCNKRSGESE